MKRILIVDDEKEICKIMREYLTSHGFDVVSKGSGDEALKCLDTEQPIDLLILDNKMPGINGIEVLKQLRDKNNNIPVIVLTGSIGITEKDISSFATILLRKPVLLEVLLERIKEVLDAG